MISLDDLRLLRAFVQVAESGGISAAARVLGIAQPTLSRRIQTLERALNAPLIQRDTHHMSLTQTGRTLLEESRDLLALADRITQRLASEQSNVQGHLRIVSVVDIGQWIIAPLLARFQAIYPQVTAELHLFNRPIRFVEEGFDCGFYVGEPLDKSLVMRPIRSMTRLLVAAPALFDRYSIPLVPRDLASMPWLGVLQPHFEMRSRISLSRDCEERRILLKPSLLLDTVTALRQAALAGSGFTMLPDWMMKNDLASGALVRVLPDWELQDVELCICYTAGHHLSGRLRAFIDFARDQIPLVIEDL